MFQCFRVVCGAFLLVPATLAWSARAPDGPKKTILSRPSLYEDARDQKWSRMNFEGNPGEALVSVENRLMLGHPHPLARQSWISLHQESGNLPTATKLKSPALPKVIGFAPRIGMINDVSDVEGMESFKFSNNSFDSEINISQDGKANSLLQRGARIAAPSTRATWLADANYLAIVGDSRTDQANKVGAQTLASARLMTQVGADFDVVAISEDGTLMASCGLSSSTVALWDVGSSRELVRLNTRDSRHRGIGCDGLQFSDDAKVLFAHVPNANVAVFSTVSHKLLVNWDFNQPSLHMQAIPRTHALAIQSDGISIREDFGDESAPAKWIPCKYNESDKRTTGFQFSQNGKRMVMLCDQQMELYELETQKVLWSRPLTKISKPFDQDGADEVTVRGLEFLDEKRLVLAQEQGLQVIDMDSGDVLQTVSTEDSGLVHEIHVGIGPVLYADFDSGQVKSWKIGASGLEMPVVERQDTSDTVVAYLDNGIAAWPQGQYVAYESPNREEVAIETVNGTRVATFRSTLRLYDGAVFTGSQRLLLTNATAGRNDEGSSLWSLVAAPKTFKANGIGRMCGPYGVRPLAQVPVVQGLGSASNPPPMEAKVTLVDLETQKTSATLPNDWVLGCSADGRFGIGLGNGEVIVRDVEKGNVISRHSEPPIEQSPYRVPVQVAISPDGSVAAAVGRGRGEAGDTLIKLLKVWRIASGEDIPLSAIASSNTGGQTKIASLLFSSDNRWLALYSGEITYLADLQQGSVGPVFGEGSLCFSPNSASIIYGGQDGMVRERDLRTGRQISQWQASDVSISSLAYSPDGKLISTVDDNGLVKLWSPESHKLLVTIAEFIDGTWAVTDPDGRYDAAKPDESIGLHWVAGNRVIELQQLERRFYTPGLLARTLAGEHLPAETGLDLIALPPLVAVTTPYSPARSNLEVTIVDDGGGIGSVQVRVNGRLLTTVARSVSGGVGKPVLLTVDLSDAPFVEDDNRIQVTAFDAANLIESHEAVSHYAMLAAARGLQVDSADTAADLGHFYAVVIGTSKFGGQNMDLRFPSKDAHSFATGLRLGANRLYGENKVWMRVLTSDADNSNDLPTKNNIRAAFDEIQHLAQPRDTLVVYLAGHGAMSRKNPDEYYYLTADAKAFDPELDPTQTGSSSVSSDELYSWLREPVHTMPLKQVVVLDTCAAGAANQSLSRLAETREIPFDQRRAIELLKDATGTYILMGSAADSVSYETSKYGEGLLTYALLEGMRGASLNDRSRLDVGRWFADASERVPELAKSIGGIQRPVIAEPKGTGFPIGLLNKEDTAKVPLNMPVPQLLRVECEDSNQEDPLDLRDPIRAQLSALSDVTARGDGGSTQVMYIDATDDDLPGAIDPKLLYSIHGDSISVHIRLVVDRKTVSEQTVSANTMDPALPKTLAEKIIEMAVAVKP